MMNASPAKLRSGDWGARVVGAVKTGDVVQITTKGGKTWSDHVARVVWSGDGVTLVALCGKRAEGRYTWREREQMGDRYAGTQYEGEYCGYRCPVSGRKCCPANGPCHDCA